MYVAILGRRSSFAVTDAITTHPTNSSARLRARHAEPRRNESGRVDQRTRSAQRSFCRSAVEFTTNVVPLKTRTWSDLRHPGRTAWSAEFSVAANVGEEAT